MLGNPDQSLPLVRVLLAVVMVGNLLPVICALTFGAVDIRKHASLVNREYARQTCGTACNATLHEGNMERSCSIVLSSITSMYSCSESRYRHGYRVSSKLPASCDCASLTRGSVSASMT